MGCDIHLYQEKKVNEKWVSADNDQGPLYDGRNYRLFSVLANVRNGNSFASTSAMITPIALPRGVPSDCCLEYAGEVEGWGMDGHSHSWLTLRDLQEYPWKSVERHGFIALMTYRTWRKSGETNPGAWCGAVSGGGVSTLTSVQADALLAQLELLVDLDHEDAAKHSGVYVEAHWMSSLRDDCKHFLDVAIPRLQELEAECGEGNARLVFFFDN